MAGVPPDYFSETGQLWGNPLYRWEAHAAEDYAWWARPPLRSCSTGSTCPDRSFSRVRGLLGNPRRVGDGGDRAMGSWRRAATSSRRSARRLGSLPLIAEDLGLITPGCRRPARRFQPTRNASASVRLQCRPGSRERIAASVYPALRRLHRHARQRHHERLVHFDRGRDHAIAGETSRPSEPSLAAISRRDGRRDPLGHDPAGPRSVADTAIVPLQDILGLDSRARMNMPGTSEGNWAGDSEGPDRRASA